MRTTRVYYEGKLATKSIVFLPNKSAHHLINVLRMKPDDTVYLFNESFGEFIGHIESAARLDVAIAIESQCRTPEVPPLTIRLGLGLSKGVRMDYAIQKSTELGVGSITPIYTQYGEVRLKQTERLEKRLQHWRQIAIKACEQSGRLSIPEIHPPIPIENWLKTSNESCRLILDVRGVQTLDRLEANNLIEVTIGPEGGFSSKELKMATDQGLTAVSLGSRILRTETAPIAALAILQHRYGDM